MEIGKKFIDIYSYNQNMSKGLEDKLFFIKHLNLNKDKSYIFVDFGCADGVLLDALYGIMKVNGVNGYFIGYDISDTMIALAKTKFSHYPANNVLFTTNWEDVTKKLSIHSDMESVLILSSVIHEVYSYSQYPGDIKEFWERVLDTGFKYICVRDMMCSKDIERKTPNYFYTLLSACSVDTELRKYLDSFEEVWGDVSKSNKQFIHFLLKYRWQINWEREVEENYFPIDLDEFLDRMKSYETTYLKRFCVPFLENCWKEDFGIEIDDFTHIKAIFEIKKN